MDNKELTKEQLLIQVKNLQKKIDSLENKLEALRLTEDALIKSENNLSAIIENNADGIVIVDTEGIVLYVNPAAENLFDKTEEEFIGFSFGFPVSSHKLTDSLVINKGDVYCEVEFRVVEVNWKNKPAFQLSVRDVTQSKMAELELIQAKNKAEESDRLKSAFLANMSHEIRTPLNGILGFADFLKEPNLTSNDQKEYTYYIQMSGIRLLNTINNIVDISKIESGLGQVTIAETNLNEKMDFTFRFFKPEAEFKGLQLSIKKGLQANDSNILTDNEKVYGILTNLVKNAIKFTNEGSIEFGYNLKAEREPTELEFYVKDTGIGISKNQQKFIFEIFRQGNDSYNRGYEGSGLGLSIAKSYVEMLGGKIWVESDEDIGSIFYFTIPYHRVSEDKEKVGSIVLENEAEFKNLKILIVEDDEISYSLLLRRVKKISKIVLHAITGVEAVETCRTHPDLDLILMDIRMPKMDGLEATRLIREFNKDVIIIAQTAFAFPDDNFEAIEAGCNEFITKPINRDALDNLIKKYNKKSLLSDKND
ncbi:MAG: response regulator [Salinivirgaceae bacterium]|nr:response regulator [Salinivirgaceae bacterium]